MNQGIQLAIEAAGSRRKLAIMLGISHQAILKWCLVPAHRLLDVEKATGVPRELLRPDLYRKGAVRLARRE